MTQAVQSATFSLATRRHASCLERFESPLMPQTLR